MDAQIPYDDDEHIVNGEYLCIRCEEFVTEDDWDQPCPAATRERVEAQF